MKGTLPGQAKPKKEEASASSDDSSANGEEPEGQKSAPDSETGGNKQEQPSRSSSKRSEEYRVQELLGIIKQAGFTPAELKTFKREAAQATEAKAPVPEKTVQPPAAAAKPPKLEDFKTWDEFQQAEREYNTANIDELVERKLQQRMQQQQADAKMAEAKQRYGDEAETYIRSTAAAVFNHTDVPPVIKAVLNESPVLADVLYVMGTNQKDFDEFIDLAKTNPGQALRKAVLLEQLVTEELKKGGSRNNGSAEEQPPPERNEAGQFVSSAQKPPAQRKPAPPPASEVSGKASAPPDEVASAVSRGDFRAYREAQNRRDLAARHGR